MERMRRGDTASKRHIIQGTEKKVLPRVRIYLLISENQIFQLTAESQTSKSSLPVTYLSQTDVTDMREDERHTFKTFAPAGRPWSWRANFSHLLRTTAHVTAPPPARSQPPRDIGGTLWQGPRSPPCCRCQRSEQRPCLTGEQAFSRSMSRATSGSSQWPP
jgi:hypothetical protein